MQSESTLGLFEKATNFQLFQNILMLYLFFYRLPMLLFRTQKQQYTQLVTTNKLDIHTCIHSAIINIIMLPFISNNNNNNNGTKIRLKFDD